MNFENNLILVILNIFNNIDKFLEDVGNLFLVLKKNVRY